jgi:zinc protease
MKITKYIAIVISIACQIQLQAQKLDRSKLPTPAPAPQIKIGKVDNFSLPNGLKVYVVTNNKVPRIAINLVLDRDPILEGNAAGYTQAVGSLLTTGTKTRTKDQFDEETDFIGATLSASSTGIYGASLKKHSQKLMEIMSDMLLNPNFTQPELDKIKKQMLSGLADAKENPNAIVGKVSQVLLFGNSHPYGEQMTPKTVENIQLDICKKYFETYFKPNIGYLAIVGDISVPEARSMVQKYLGSWKAGKVPTNYIATNQAIEKTKVIIVDRPNAVQSVIRVINPAKLTIGSPDVIKSRITNDILGGGEARLFNNLREKHGYTYGAYSGLQSDKHMGKFSVNLSVRNAVTDSAIAEVIKELQLITSTPPAADELERTKSDLTGSFVFSLERPQTIADFAINTARYNLPGNYYSNYLKEIEAATATDVQAMAQKYIKPNNAYIIVVGKALEITDKLKKFGEIEYYDAEGNKTKAPEAPKAAPAGLTTDMVLKKYIDALGGASKIAAINDITVNMKGQIPNGPELQAVVTKKAPGKSLTELKVMGNTMQKIVVDGTMAYTEIQGQKNIQKDSELAQSIGKSKLFYELNPSAAGMTTSLAGTEIINGATCQKVEFKLAGSTWAEYYDTTTGYKVRSIDTQKSPAGEVQITTDYKDYKTIEGVMVPHTITQMLGPGMSIDLKLSSASINKGVADEIFK